MKKLFSLSFLILLTLQLYAVKQSLIDDLYACYPFTLAKWSERHTIESEGQTTVALKTVYLKDKQMRVDERAEKSNKLKQITILGKEFSYIILPETKNGMRFSHDTNGPLNQQAAIARAGKTARLTGSEKFKRKACDIYEYAVEYDSFMPQLSKNIRMKSTIKEWRDKKDNFVWKKIIKTAELKIDLGLTSKKIPASTVTIEISNLKKNVQISDEKFTPAKSYTITDMDKITDMPAGSTEEKKESPAEKLIKGLSD